MCPQRSTVTRRCEGQTAAPRSMMHRIVGVVLALSLSTTLAACSVAPPAPSDPDSNPGVTMPDSTLSSDLQAIPGVETADVTEGVDGLNTYLRVALTSASDALETDALRSAIGVVADTIGEDIAYVWLSARGPQGDLIDLSDQARELGFGEDELRGGMLVARTSTLQSW